MDAKTLLFSFADSLKVKPSGLPRFIKRQASDNKRRLDCEDLIGLYAVLDTAGVTLPTYTAANLGRLPSVCPGDVDVFAIATSVAALASQLEVVIKRLDAIEQHGAGTVSSVLNLMLDRLNVMESKDNLEPKKSVSTSVTLDTKCSSITGTQPSIAQANSVNPPSLTSTSVPPPVSWATTASANNEGWKEVSRKTKVAVKVKGTRSDLSVKAVPRKEIVAAFVGRLNPDTEENDLRDFLTSAGLNDVKCKKLKVKDGQKFKFNTAAFFVSCSADCKELFYDGSTWPEGAEVRDWVFHNSY